MKVLVPSIAAGAIIGKNGEAIGQMQRETGAKIKLSKLNDFYPGSFVFILIFASYVPLKYDLFHFLSVAIYYVQ